MYKSKLIQIVSSFSKGELKNMITLAEAKANNKDTKVLSLALYLADIASDINEENTEKEVVYRKLFKEERYDDAKMRAIMNQLTKIVEKVILDTYLQEEPLEEKALYTKVFLKRGITSLVHRTANEWKKELDNIEIRDEIFYGNKHYSEHQRLVFGDKKDTDWLEACNAHLVDWDKHYLIRKLKLSLLMLNYSFHAKEEIKIAFLEEILLSIRNTEYEKDPVIRLYQLCIFTQIYPGNDSGFKEYIELLNKNSNLLRQEELQILYKHALNFCATRMRSGAMEYRKQAFGIYQQMLEKKIIGLSGIEIQDFKNILRLGLENEEVKWVEKFIKTYRGELPDAYQVPLSSLGMAMIAMKKKDFTSILKQLNWVDTKDVFIQAAVRVLRLKTFYELKDFEPLESLLEASRKYFADIDIPENNKLGFQNFLKLLRSLVRAYDNPSQLLKFSKEIYQTVPLEEKDWLLEKFYESV